MSGQMIIDKPIITVTPSDSQIPPAKPPRIHAKDIFKNIVNREEVEYLAKRSLSHEVEVVEYHLRPYSEEKIGFLGSHLCLIIVTRLPGYVECERLSFFVKTVPYDVPSQAAYVEEKGCFRKESDFFRILVPLMLEDGCKDESWTPDCYLAKLNVLVFEDMKYKGFANRSRMFDERTMKSAVECIARFHACSLVLEEKLNGIIHR